MCLVWWGEEDKMKYFENKKSKDSISKKELIDKIAELTELNKKEVTDVVNAITDIAIGEIVMNGCFRLPEVFTVTSEIKENYEYYKKDIDKTLSLPEFPKLKITLAKSTKELAKEFFENIIISKDGSSRKNWYLPYIKKDGSPYNIKKKDEE